MKEEKRKMAEKVGNYAKYVKEMYWPKVSERKKMEMDAFMQELKQGPIRKSASTKKNLLFHNQDNAYDMDELRPLTNQDSLPILH